jgi:hypothetical protein
MGPVGPLIRKLVGDIVNERSQDKSVEASKQKEQVIRKKQENRKHRIIQSDQNRQKLLQKRAAEHREAEERAQERRARTEHALQRKQRMQSEGKVARIASRDAADLIARCPEGLLIITTDASAGGASSGSAAVLRCCERGHDRVRTVVQYHPWSDAGPAEIAAVALACDAASKDRIRGRRVLIVMDSNLEFFDPKAKAHALERDLLFGDQYLDAFQRLVDASTRVSLAKVKSVHKARSGFIDHAVADLLAAKAKDKDFAARFHHDLIYMSRLDHVSLEWLRYSEQTAKRKLLTVKRNLSVQHLACHLYKINVVDDPVEGNSTREDRKGNGDDRENLDPRAFKALKTCRDDNGFRTSRPAFRSLMRKS